MPWEPSIIILTQPQVDRQGRPAAKSDTRVQAESWKRMKS